MVNKNPEENLTYEDVAKVIDPAGNLGITKNTVMRMIKEGLPVTEITPNNRVIKRKHLDEYLESKKKSTAKQDIIPDNKDESNSKTDDVLILKINQEKAEIQSRIDRANAETAEALMRKRLAEANIKKIDEIEDISKDFDNKFKTLEEQKTTLQVDLDELDKRTKEIEQREIYITEQSSKIEEILNRERNLNNRDNKIAERENSINTLESGYQNTINEFKEQLHLAKELYESQILHIKNLKLDMQIIQCSKCSRLKKHADCDLAQLLNND